MSSGRIWRGSRWGCLGPESALAGSTSTMLATLSHWKKRPQRRESPVHGTARVLRLLKLTEIPAQLPVRRMQGVDAHTLRPRRIVAKVDAIGAQRVLRAVALGPIRFYEPLDQRAIASSDASFCTSGASPCSVSPAASAASRVIARIFSALRGPIARTRKQAARSQLFAIARQGRPGLARHRRHSARACCEYAATRVHDAEVHMHADSPRWPVGGVRHKRTERRLRGQLRRIDAAQARRNGKRHVQTRADGFAVPSVPAS